MLLNLKKYGSVNLNIDFVDANNKIPPHAIRIGIFFIESLSEEAVSCSIIDKSSLDGEGGESEMILVRILKSCKITA